MEEQEWEKFKTETKKQLSTFFKSSKYANTAKHEILDIFDKIDVSHRDVITILRIVSASKNPREITVAGMLAFLWEFEGSYSSTIDAFCYLLVVNGHDLFDIISRKYVHSLEDIGKVHISPKLNFLKEHDFGIFNRTEDKKLRDKIAHYRFTWDDSGRLLIDNQTVDIESRLDDLFFFTHQVFKTLLNCFEEC